MSAPRGGGSNASTAYSLALLAEYTHTLDSLPLDLSRNFADLRELDAVLSSSMASITTKIQNLTKMLEEGTGLKEERLWLLTEISEEAMRLKPGGEDKIRVACLAADNLKSHYNHLHGIAEHIPGFDANTLERATTYPHVSAKSFLPVAAFESGRRRRGGFGSLLVPQVEQASPNKRKRVAREDDPDVKSPRKDRTGEAASRPRNNGRSRKTDRAGSPTESILSVTSHQPQQAFREPASVSARAVNGTSTTNKRRANGNRDSPMDYSSFDPNTRRDGFNVPPTSSSHPSLVPFAGNGMDYAPPVGNDWNTPRQLEGPGVPVPRNRTPYNAVAEPIITPAVSLIEGVEGDGEGDGEVDDKPYCVCGGPSHGEMVACDGDNCELEWFHLGCVGLTIVPKGEWYCEDCKSKRTAKRPARGGKRRAGGRSGK